MQLNFFSIHSALAKKKCSLVGFRKLRLFVSVLEYPNMEELFNYLRLNYVLDSYTDDYGYSRIDCYLYNDIISVLSLHGLDYSDYLLED